MDITVNASRYIVNGVKDKQFGEENTPLMDKAGKPYVIVEVAAYDSNGASTIKVRVPGVAPALAIGDDANFSGLKGRLREAPVQMDNGRAYTGLVASFSADKVQKTS
jgi:hypothetical protein